MEGEQGQPWSLQEPLEWKSQVCLSDPTRDLHWDVHAETWEPCAPDPDRAARADGNSGVDRVRTYEDYATAKLRDPGVVRVRTYGDYATARPRDPGVDRVRTCEDCATAKPRDPGVDRDRAYEDCEAAERCDRDDEDCEQPGDGV